MGKTEEMVLQGALTCGRNPFVLAAGAMITPVITKYRPLYAISQRVEQIMTDILLRSRSDSGGSTAANYHPPADLDLSFLLNKVGVIDQDNSALSVTKKRLGQLNRSPTSLKSVDVANVKYCRPHWHGSHAGGGLLSQAVGKCKNFRGLRFNPSRGRRPLEPLG